MRGWPGYSGFPGGGFRAGRTRIAQRVYPDSAAAWALTFPGLPTPVGIWTFQDVASPIDDKVGANDLVENQSLLYAQAGDTTPTRSPRRSVELDTASTNEWAGTASTAFADIGGAQSRSLLVRARVPDIATIVPLMGAGSIGNVPRWGLRTSAGGNLIADARDGAAVVITATTVSVYDDGNYHDFVFALDRSGGFLHAMVDAAEDVSTALGALAAIDCDTGLRVGSYSARTPAVGQRFSYAAMFDAYFTAAHLVTFRTPR